MFITVWGYTHSCVLWPNLGMIIKERLCTIHFDVPVCFKQDVLCVILVCKFYIHSYKLLKNCSTKSCFFEIQLKYRQFKSFQFPLKIMQLDKSTVKAIWLDWNNSHNFKKNVTTYFNYSILTIRDLHVKLNKHIGFVYQVIYVDKIYKTRTFIYIDPNS